jgi:hypothetical protein
MATDYAVKVAPPPGMKVGSLVGLRGHRTDLLPYADGCLTVITQEAVNHLVGQGWRVISITAAAGGGHHG